VLKLADMPSCPGGEEHSINLIYIWIGYISIRMYIKAKSFVEVRILLSQLFWNCRIQNVKLCKSIHATFKIQNLFENIEFSIQNGVNELIQNSAFKILHSLQCEVLKLADMPSCLEGGESAINERYGLTTKFRSSEFAFWLSALWRFESFSHSHFYNFGLVIYKNSKMATLLFFLCFSFTYLLTPHGIIQSFFCQ